MNPTPKILPAVIFLGFTASLFAADPQPKIADLSAWAVLGADKELLAKSETLSLPAGAQLYRTIASGRITLHVESSPVFSMVAADIPVLELGDTALAFLRDGERGLLVLVLGDNPAQTLPYEFALAGDGQSHEPLSLTLSREGATVAVTTRGQTLQFPAGYSARPQEVVLSAGAGQPWPIQGLALTVAANQDPDEAVPGQSGSGRGYADQVRQQAVRPAGVARTASGEASGTAATAKGTAAAATKAQSRPVIMEIFTPPSVRLGRAGQVRALAMKSLKK